MNLHKILFIGILLVSGCSSRQASQHFSERIIFFGDSITELGVKPNGYVSLVRDSLNTLGLSIDIIGAGISGNKISDLHARVDADVISKRPTIVVIYIGINDVWHFEFARKGLTGTSKDDFRSGLEKLVEQIQTAGAKAILCTPSVIGEKKDGQNKYDELLDEYSDISRNIANAKGVLLCDLRKAFLEYLKSNNPQNLEKNILTYDGVHLNDFGNRMVAQKIILSLDGLGVFFPKR